MYPLSCSSPRSVSGARLTWTFSHKKGQDEHRMRNASAGEGDPNLCEPKRNSKLLRAVVAFGPLWIRLTRAT